MVACSNCVICTMSSVRDGAICHVDHDLCLGLGNSAMFTMTSIWDAAIVIEMVSCGNCVIQTMAISGMG